MHTKSVLFSLPAQRLFIVKLVGISIALAILVPAVYFKLSIPAGIYLAALLILHIGFLYLYCVGVAWKSLLKNKLAFSARIAGIVTLAYLLTVLHYEGTLLLIALNVALALLIHIIILLTLMVEVGTREV